MAASWYVAPSVKLIFAEVNYVWPGRSRKSDGTIGDPDHASRASDHNPNLRRSVNAGDITSVGIDAYLVIAKLIADRRTNYVIHKRTIWSRSNGFRPRRYYGANPHNIHIHVSILQARWAEIDVSPWGIRTYAGLPTAPRPSPSLPSTGDMSLPAPPTTTPSTTSGELSMSAAEVQEVKKYITAEAQETRKVLMAQTYAIAEMVAATPLKVWQFPVFRTVNGKREGVAIIQELADIKTAVVSLIKKGIK